MNSFNTQSFESLKFYQPMKYNLELVNLSRAHTLKHCKHVYRLKKRKKVIEKE